MMCSLEVSHHAKNSHDDAKEPATFHQWQLLARRDSCQTRRSALIVTSAKLPAYDNELMTENLTMQGISW